MYGKVNSVVSGNVCEIAKESAQEFEELLRGRRTAHVKQHSGLGAISYRLAPGQPPSRNLDNRRVKAPSPVPSVHC